MTIITGIILELENINPYRHDFTITDGDFNVMSFLLLLYPTPIVMYNNFAYSLDNKVKIFDNLSLFIESKKLYYECSI